MPLITGFVLSLLAGVTMGLSGWSIKLVRVWKWENFWLVYAIVSHRGLYRIRHRSRAASGINFRLAVGSEALPRFRLRITLKRHVLRHPRRQGLGLGLLG
jgi:hypothetical protein